MTFQMLSTESVKVSGSPVDVNENPSQAVLSNWQYSSSDSNILTVTPDPEVPGGAIIKGVPLPAGASAVSATLLETATATEPDGTTTEVIQGVATIVLTSAPPPPPLPAASLVFTFGEPFPTVAS